MRKMTFLSVVMFVGAGLMFLALATGVRADQPTIVAYEPTSVATVLNVAPTVVVPTSTALPTQLPTATPTCTASPTATLTPTVTPTATATSTPTLVPIPELTIKISLLAWKFVVVTNVKMQLYEFQDEWPVLPEGQKWTYMDNMRHFCTFYPRSIRSDEQALESVETEYGFDCSQVLAAVELFVIVLR